MADQLPNLAIPELDSVGAQEIFVTAAFGVTDFISAMDTERIREWNAWYHVMNCGFPVSVAGETDFPCMSGTRVGQGRTYVQLGTQDRVDFLAGGRRFVGDTIVLREPQSVEPLFQRGQRLVELIVNGHVAASREVPADGREHPVEFSVAIERSSWVALRQFPQRGRSTAASPTNRQQTGKGQQGEELQDVFR